MSQNQIISFDISSLLRGKKVTMRDFCASVGITLNLFREIRAARKCVLADAEIFVAHARRLSGKGAA